MTRYQGRWRETLLCAFVFATAGGCENQPPQGPSAAPPAVTVSVPIERAVTDYDEFIGRTAAVESVGVRARVSGYLQKVNFKDGADVKAGAVLFEIDPRTFKAAYDAAVAQVKLAEAQLKFTDAEYKRNQRLVDTGAVSVEDLQKSLASRDTSSATLDAGTATAAQRKVDLDFTKVTAPIGGRASRTMITAGNLVTADNTLLTTIVTMDPMYAYFDVDENTLLRIQQLIREGKFKSAREQGVKVPVDLALSNEEGFPHQGTVDFVNNRIDPSTGTLQVRGIFPNPKLSHENYVLSPGMFVRVRVQVGAPYKAILVSERALGSDLGQQYLYVVDDKNEVVRRDVTVGAVQNGLRVIAEGLKPDEHVIVNGLQRVRPGVKVNPKLESMPVPPPAAQPRPAMPAAKGPGPAADQGK